MSQNHVARDLACDPAQVAHECLGRLSDLITKLRERDARGDDDAMIDLEFLADDLCSLLADYTEIANDVDPGETQQEAA